MISYINLLFLYHFNIKLIRIEKYEKSFNLFKYNKKKIVKF